MSRSARSTKYLFAVAAGGAFGAGLRFAVNLVFEVVPGFFPWATLAVNVAGSFLLGGLLTLVLEHWPPTRYVRPFAAIGLLGGFTTFSTFALETVWLMRSGHPIAAGVYVGLSVTAGLAAVVIGARLADRWPRTKRARP